MCTSLTSWRDARPPLVPATDPQESLAERNCRVKYGTIMVQQGDGLGLQGVVTFERHTNLSTTNNSLSKHLEYILSYAKCSGLQPHRPTKGNGKGN